MRRSAPYRTSRLRLAHALSVELRAPPAAAGDATVRSLHDMGHAGTVVRLALSERRPLAHVRVVAAVQAVVFEAGLGLVMKWVNTDFLYDIYKVERPPRSYSSWRSHRWSRDAPWWSFWCTPCSSGTRSGPAFVPPLYTPFRCPDLCRTCRHPGAWPVGRLAAFAVPPELP